MSLYLQRISIFYCYPEMGSVSDQRGDGNKSQEGRVFTLQDQKP